MKKVILFALLMPFTAFGQIVENFEAGNLNNWTQYPSDRWETDSVSPVSGLFSLHHSFDNSEAGADRVGLEINNLCMSEGFTRWAFQVKYNYDPSASNNWGVFLVSESEPSAMSPEETTGAFIVGVNQTGYDDTLRLWKIRSGVVTPVVRSHINWQNDIGRDMSVRVSVERSAGGLWTMNLYDENDVVLDSSAGSDPELLRTEWFGILYRYSSTCDRLLWIDDIIIEGIFHEDNEAPRVMRCESSGLKSIKVVLNEDPTDDFLKTANFYLNQESIQPATINRLESLTYNLIFENRLVNKTTNILEIRNLCDDAGNCTTNVRLPFDVVWVEPGDVIISEIMADPIPAVALPGKEYIELTNRTLFPFNLKNWRMTSGDQSVQIPEHLIDASESLIMCSIQDTSLFKPYGNVLGIKQFPALTDAGKIICITDSSGKIIHGVEYSDSWYADELKSGGGWSLEMVDTDYPFFSEGNWKASLSRLGGTPGLVNSVTEENADILFYGLVNIFPDDSCNIRVRFSEPLIDFTDRPGDVKIEGEEIMTINPADPLYREFLIRIQGPLTTGEIYNVEIETSLSDFSGNLIGRSGYSFGVPEQSQQHDLLFNELLFNPFPGDPDFIELYNTSDKIIDASRLVLVSVNDNTGDTSQGYLVSREGRCILPGTYYAVTTDRKSILRRFPLADPDYIFEIGSIPSMPDDKGHIILFNRELDKIDEVIYNEKMHNSLLADYEGISLEKTDPYASSESPVSWHSATESSGWATPGGINSLYVEMPSTGDDVSFSSTRISPDGDGNEDLLEIRFSLKGISNVVSIVVFDETGSYLKKIAQNMLAGPETILTWDGTSDDGSYVRSGIYILLINIFDENGKTRTWKKVCTVIRR
jgi:hypothetical protein